MSDHTDAQFSIHDKYALILADKFASCPGGLSYSFSPPTFFLESGLREKAKGNERTNAFL